MGFHRIFFEISMKRQQEPRHGKFGTNLNSCCQGFALAVLEVGILHIGPEHLGMIAMFH